MDPTRSSSQRGYRYPMSSSSSTSPLDSFAAGTGTRFAHGHGLGPTFGDSNSGASLPPSSSPSAPYIRRPEPASSLSMRNSTASSSLSSSTVLYMSPSQPADQYPPSFGLRPSSSTYLNSSSSSTPLNSSSSFVLPPLNPNQYQFPHSPSIGSYKGAQIPRLSVKDSDSRFSLFSMDPNSEQPQTADSGDEPYQAWPRVESWGYTKYKADSDDNDDKN